MKREILILGQNPSSAKPFKNNTVERLSKWLKYANIHRYDFDNVSQDVGHIFEVNVDHVKKITRGYNKIVALGGIASNVLCKLDIPHLKMPHPSPRNRQLNCKEFEEEKMKKLREYAGTC